MGEGWAGGGRGWASRRSPRRTPRHVASPHRSLAQPRVRALAELFASAGVVCKVPAREEGGITSAMWSTLLRGRRMDSPRLDQSLFDCFRWRKFIGIAAFSAVGAATRATLGA